MLNRDFSKTKVEYLKKNKIALIIIGCFLLAGILFLSICGMNTSPDFSGCKKFEILVGSEVSNKDLDDYSNKINSALNNNNCELYTLTFKGEGDNSTLEVKYTGKTNQEKIDKINSTIATKLELSVSNISEHEKVSKTVRSTDYIYTALACLLILIFALIFVWARHNLAYGMCLLGTSLFSFVALIFTMSILRIQIGASFFFMVVASILFTSFTSLILFENMREVRKNKDYKNDLSKQLVLGLKNMTKELQFGYIGLFLLGFLFVIFGTQASRLVALVFMFTVLISMMSVVFILPFIYNLIADKAKFKKVSTANKATKKTSEQAEFVAGEGASNEEMGEENSNGELNEEKTNENLNVEGKVDEAESIPQDEK